MCVYLPWRSHLFCKITDISLCFLLPAALFAFSNDLFKQRWEEPPEKVINARSRTQRRRRKEPRRQCSSMKNEQWKHKKHLVMHLKSNSTQKCSAHDVSCKKTMRHDAMYVWHVYINFNRTLYIDYYQYLFKLLLNHLWWKLSTSVWDIMTFWHWSTITAI